MPYNTYPAQKTAKDIAPSLVKSIPSIGYAAPKSASTSKKKSPSENFGGGGKGPQQGPLAPSPPRALGPLRCSRGRSHWFALPCLGQPSHPLQRPYPAVHSLPSTALRDMSCPAPVLARFWMPDDVQNIAFPLRGSSFSSISPFLLMNRLLLSKQLQNGGLGPPGASPESAEKLAGTSSGEP